ncbi:hypothetical protein EIP86_001668 [Pleurotus ostreatoroseus]|nr:hypothetical protein EIP86_001668 [Pleurotus ostreatoroseus]
MENPHAERQNVLLQRIIKNAEKCTETIIELNRCLEVRYTLGRILCHSIIVILTQEIIRANEQVTIAADLVTKYRKNVQYNLEATGTQAQG